MRESDSFVLNGHAHQLTRATVEERLAGAAPEPIQKHGAQIGAVWFPVLQAFEIVLGVPRNEFVSQTRDVTWRRSGSR
ncbi:MAG: hypothetical protein ACRDP1_04595 [Nocardioidaceae bacterium]